MVERIFDQEQIDAMVRAARGVPAAEPKVKQRKVASREVRQAARIGASRCTPSACCTKASRAT